MRRRSHIGVIFLTILAFMPAPVLAQDPGNDASPRTSDSGFELLQNYPNPFNPTTRIPFVLTPDLFENAQGETQQVVVTIRIFNVLQQFVAHPTALGHPDGNGVLVNGLEYYTPGRKEAFWDGLDQNGRQVASGMYYLQMIVNGRRQIMKMIVAK
ncbi:MAG: hypothetical protein R3314_07660 [Longimicrobiales bacterium]|nr:hypothetical protein [Longimicrobiales bacterium]